MISDLRSIVLDWNGGSSLGDNVGGKLTNLRPPLNYKHGENLKFWHMGILLKHDIHIKPKSYKLELLGELVI